jgi:hypothetical protein
MNKDIINLNKKGQRHGYNARYTNEDEIMSRGNYKNNKVIGYEEWHHHWHYPKKTNFYIR